VLEIPKFFYENIVKYIYNETNIENQLFICRLLSKCRLKDDVKLLLLYGKYLKWKKSWKPESDKVFCASIFMLPSKCYSLLEIA